MPLQSDITISVSKFDPVNNSDQAIKVNEQLIKILDGGPKWYEVGASKYREMRWAGNTPLPPPRMLPQAMDIKIPSRESGRDIPCRLMYPTSRPTEELRKQCKGVVIHYHGGGWVLGDEKSTDSLLQHYANAGDMAVISVGYRHAPEDPFPKGPEDCVDAAEYLVENAESQYGGSLKFIGGESAGAHLSLITTFHLLKTKPNFKLAGLLLHFGCYDLSGLPSMMHFNKILILNQKIMEHFFDAFLPNTTVVERRDPKISPYYENLEPFRGKLPKAIFTVGTEDPFLDDSISMGMKWMIAGGEAVVRLYSGAPHGFIGFPPDLLKEAGEALADTQTFIQDCLNAL